MSLRILLVDDDETTVRLIGRLLRSEGHVVQTCETGALALEQLRAAPYDLLLTDLVMPAMGGLELVTAARQLRPELRAVVMSGHGRIEGVAEEVGWLDKPIDLDLLLLLVASGTASAEQPAA